MANTSLNIHRLFIQYYIVILINKHFQLPPFVMMNITITDIILNFGLYENTVEIIISCASLNY